MVRFIDIIQESEGLKIKSTPLDKLIAMQPGWLWRRASCILVFHMRSNSAETL